MALVWPPPYPQFPFVLYFPTLMASLSSHKLTVAQFWGITFWWLLKDHQKDLWLFRKYCWWQDLCSHWECKYEEIEQSKKVILSLENNEWMKSQQQDVALTRLKNILKRDNDDPLKAHSAVSTHDSNQTELGGGGDITVCLPCQRVVSGGAGVIKMPA